MILPFFPTASIYKEEEIILEPKNNIYFRIVGVASVLDFNCKILEWCSRACFKGLTEYWQRYFRRGLNSYFGKNWTKENYDLIYTRLGNGVNRSLCIEFINSGFNINLLAEDRTSCAKSSQQKIKEQSGTSHNTTK